MVTKREAEELIADAQLFNRKYWPQYIEFELAIQDHYSDEEWKNVPQDTIAMSANNMSFIIIPHIRCGIILLQLILVNYFIRQ